MRTLKKILQDIFCSKDGRVVYEKVGAVSAHIVASYVIILQARVGELQSEIFIAYLAFAGGHAVFSKYQTLKYGNTNATNNTQTPV